MGSQIHIYTLQSDLPTQYLNFSYYVSYGKLQRYLYAQDANKRLRQDMTRVSFFFFPHIEFEALMEEMDGLIDWFEERK